MKLGYLSVTLGLVIKVVYIFGVPSCIFPPCRYNINRQPLDMTSITVRDNSSLSINWQWDIKGGRWDVIYRYTYPGGWYEGIVVFMNSSAVMNGQKQAYVSWGYSKNWESNAVLIYANAWNITYNGDVFGFIPTGNGRYIFRIFTKNRRHNPFANEEITVAPSLCSLTSSDISLIQKWWVQRKTQRNCAEPTVNYSWNGQNGRWRVVYKWIEESDKTVSDVYYTFYNNNNNNVQELKVIHWEIDVSKKIVTYTTNPLKLINENSWRLTFNNAESWGFQPIGEAGEWIFRHFSRNLVFYPLLK